MEFVVFFSFLISFFFELRYLLFNKLKNRINCLFHDTFFLVIFKLVFQNIQSLIKRIKYGICLVEVLVIFKPDIGFVKQTLDLLQQFFAILIRELFLMHSVSAKEICAFLVLTDAIF